MGSKYDYLHILNINKTTMADKKISQLTTTVTTADADLFVMVQGGITKSINFGALKLKFLQPLNNLSDLGNTTTARTNLGVYSTAQTDVAIAAFVAAQQVFHDMLDVEASAGGNFSTATNPARLRRRFGHVNVEGEMVRSSTTPPGTVVFTLPVGYRPLRNFLQFSLMDANLVMRSFFLNSTGQLQYAGPGTIPAAETINLNQLNFETN